MNDLFSSVYINKQTNKTENKTTTEKRKRSMPKKMQGSWYLHTKWNSVVSKGAQQYNF